MVVYQEPPDQPPQPPPFRQQQQHQQGLALAPFVRRSARAMPNVGPGRECKFCKNNGEPCTFFLSFFFF